MGRPKREDHPIQRQLPKQHHDKAVPFPEGNTLSLVHGLYSKYVRPPIEERFAEAIRQSMEESLGSAYNPALDEHAIRRAARALTTVEMTEALIDEHGVEAISDKAAQHYKIATNQAAKWLTELGLTPSARAKLGVDVARQYDLIAALEDRRAQRDRPRPAKHICDYCGDRWAKYRIKSQGRVICVACAEEGAHR